MVVIETLDFSELNPISCPNWNYKGTNFIAFIVRFHFY